MNAAPIRKCPLCLRPLSEHERAAMGLRSGDLLSALCPGRIGPSDIDHVIHNGASNPHRLAVIEYKGGAPVGIGQRILFGAIQGDWIELATGRALTIRVFVIADDHEPAAQLREAVDWTFAGRGRRVLSVRRPLRPPARRAPPRRARLVCGRRPRARGANRVRDPDGPGRALATGRAPARGPLVPLVRRGRPHGARRGRGERTRRSPARAMAGRKGAVMAMQTNCPECGQRVTITRGGRLRRHWIYFGSPDEPRPAAAIPCSGSGLSAAEVLAEEIAGEVDP